MTSFLIERLILTSCLLLFASQLLTVKCAEEKEFLDRNGLILATTSSEPETPDNVTVATEDMDSSGFGEVSPIIEPESTPSAGEQQFSAFQTPVPIEIERDDEQVARVVTEVIIEEVYSSSPLPITHSTHESSSPETPRSHEDNSTPSPPVKNKIHDKLNERHPNSLEVVSGFEKPIVRADEANSGGADESLTVSNVSAMNREDGNGSLLGRPMTESSGQDFPDSLLALLDLPPSKWLIFGLFGLIAGLIVLVLIIVIAVSIYHKRYPVRMRFGRKFSTFENPIYRQKPTSPGITSSKELRRLTGEQSNEINCA